MVNADNTQSLVILGASGVTEIGGNVVARFGSTPIAGPLTVGRLAQIGLGLPLLFFADKITRNPDAKIAIKLIGAGLAIKSTVGMASTWIPEIGPAGGMVARGKRVSRPMDADGGRGFQSQQIGNGGLGNVPTF